MKLLSGVGSNMLKNERLLVFIDGHGLEVTMLLQAVVILFPWPFAMLRKV